MENNYSVYVHRTPDGMYYAGVSKNVKNRWQAGQYKDSSLWPYIEQYGFDNIEHAVVVDGVDRETALRLEDMLIQMYHSFGKGINRQRSGLVTVINKQAYQNEYQRNRYANNKEYSDRIRQREREKYKNSEYAEQKRQYQRDKRANDPEWVDNKRKYGRQWISTPEGRIYSRVANFNRRHPDRAVETPMEAKLKFLESGYIPQYIKHDDIDVAAE